MPFKWTLNPYRGCTHGCHYCFARRYQVQLELSSDDEFASVIFVKTNFVDVLRKELDHPKWTRELAALGTATDPYQPIEGHYKLSRGTLQALVAGKTPVGIVTKGPMVVRDIDLLTDLSRVAGATICVSVPTVDDSAWRTLEPGTAAPMQRLRAVRTLVDAGLDAGVLMNPLVPGFSTHPAKIEATIKAVADHGARFVGSNTMFLEGGTRDHFMRFLQQQFPALVGQYGYLYAAKYLPRDYRERVQKTVGMLKIRYGLADRKRRGENVNSPEEPASACNAERQASQGELRWS
jgi:DNA repair photolyase